MATKVNGITSRSLRRLPTNLQAKITRASENSSSRRAATAVRRPTSTPSPAPAPAPAPAPTTSTTQSLANQRATQINKAFDYTLGDLIGYDQVDAINQELKNSIWRAVDDSEKRVDVQTISFDIANGSTSYYPGKLVTIDKSNFFKAGPKDFIIGADQRAPVTLRVEIGGDQREEYDLDVSKNTETKINKAIANSVKTAFAENGNKPLPINTILDFSGKEIFSKEHLETQVTCKIPSFGFDSSLSTSTTTTKNYVLYKIVQKYYTAYYDHNLSMPSDMFNLEEVDDNLINKLQTYKAKTPVAYISEVTYGRVILMMLSSELSVEKIKSAVNVSVSGVSVDSKVTSEKERKQIEISVVAYGGDADAATNLCSATLQDFTKDKSYSEALKRVLDDNKFTKPSDAVPISYKMKYLLNNEYVQVNSSFKDVDVEDEIKIRFEAGSLGVVVNTYTRYMAPVMKNGKLQWEAFKSQNKRVLTAFDSESVTIPARARFIQFSISPQVNGDKYTIIIDSLPLKGCMKNGDYHEFKVKLNGCTAQSFTFSPNVSGYIKFNQSYSLYEDKKYDGVFKNVSTITDSEKGSFYDLEKYIEYLANQDFERYSENVKGLRAFTSSSLIREQDAAARKEQEQKKTSRARARTGARAK